MVLLFVIAYLGIQLVISIVVSKQIHSEKDFFLAGRKLPTWLLSFSLFATWFGAETTIGTSGAVFKEGLSGSRADPFGYSLCLFFLGWLLATKLWQGGYTTLADFFKDRFGEKIEKLAILIIVPSSIIWGAAQLRAFGQVVSSVTDWDIQTTLWIAFAFVTIYTLLGGLLGDIITDMIQGIMIALGLTTILYFILASGFDFSSWWEGLPKEKLSFKGQNENLWQRIDRWSIPIFGSLVAQELISRTLSARNAKVAKRSAYYSGLIYLLFGSIPVILGLMGPSLIEGITHHEEFIIQLAQKFLPGFAFVIFSGALISAILATIDSILLSSSALISHNILVPALNLKNERSKLNMARLMVVVSALICMIIAFYSDSIYDLVETASSFGTAGILVICLCGLHFKKGGQLSAGVALIAGLLVMPLAEYVLAVPAPFVVTILTSLGLYWVFAVFRPANA